MITFLKYRKVLFRFSKVIEVLQSAERQLCVLLPCVSIHDRCHTIDSVLIPVSEDCVHSDPRSLVVVDPDDHDLEVEMTCGVEHTFAPSLVAGEYIFKVVGKNVDPGSYEAVVNATDEYGLQTKKTIPFEVLDNQAPVKLQEIEDILLSSRGKEFIIDMEDYVSDPDGEQLKYTISVSNEKVVNVTPRQDILYVTALAYGLVDVKVTASDVRGQSVEFDFKVLVKDTSDPLSLYPNPVKDFLNVSTVDLADTEIVISSSTGKVMFHDVMKVSALQPARIDMSSYVPGTYSVQVRFGGKEYKKNVVKL